MKNLIVTIVLACLSFNANSTTIIFEDVVKKSEVITTKIGSDGKPLIGAAVGVGFGSAFGSGSGKNLRYIIRCIRC